MSTTPQEYYEDWRHEVANGDTLRGYREWVEAREEADLFCEEVTYAEPHADQQRWD